MFEIELKYFGFDVDFKYDFDYRYLIISVLLRARKLISKTRRFKFQIFNSRFKFSDFISDFDNVRSSLVQTKK